MIVLAVLLWIQVVILALFMGTTIYICAKDAGRYGPSVAWFSGILFGGLTVISSVAAVVVGGLT